MRGAQQVPILRMDLKMQFVAFDLSDDVCRVTVKGDTAVYHLSFGNGRWVSGVTTRSGPNLLYGAVHHDVGLPAFRIAGLAFLVLAAVRRIP